MHMTLLKTWGEHGNTTEKRNLGKGISWYLVSNNGALLIIGGRCHQLTVLYPSGK